MTTSTKDKKYSVAVYIGRFQPFHNGHLHAIKEGLRIADRVLILVGSADSPRTTKNPFTFGERGRMIQEALAASSIRERYQIRAINDFPYNEQEWIAAVQEEVTDFADNYVPGSKGIVLIGHVKDASSYYLRCFPTWDFVDTGHSELESRNGFKMKIDATKIREFFFEDTLQYATGVVPSVVLDHMCDFKHNMPGTKEAFARLRDEYYYIKEYKRSWEAAPFPPTFVTADAIVIQAGHVLVVERGGNPGKGLLALPGGFVNQNETVRAAAIRELIEETNIHLQPQVLDRCIVHEQVFDDPGRSLRGRTITHAFLVKLDDTRPLPEIKGGDDAAKAMWLPLRSVSKETFFEDHADIIRTMAMKL